MNDEKDVPESEVIDFNRPSYVFKPNEQHEWRMQGPYLVCKSCELQHAVFIGMGKILVGLNGDGTPKLINRDEKI